MEKEANSLYRALIQDEIRPLLKKHDFRCRGSVFRRRRDGVWHLVALQKSRKSTARRTIFTVNLGVASERIMRWEALEPARCGIVNCHWRARLGHLSPERRDVWWTFENEASSAMAGTQVKQRLEDYGLPELDKLEDDFALRDLWLSEKSPGLTDTERLFDLSILLRDLGPRDEYEASIAALKELAASKSAPMVTVYLREIGEDPTPKSIPKKWP
jgi:hypothetical protein